MKTTNLACIADDSPKAQRAYEELRAHYEFVDIARRKPGRSKIKPDVIVVPGAPSRHLPLHDKALLDWLAPRPGMRLLDVAAAHMPAARRITRIADLIDEVGVDALRTVHGEQWIALHRPLAAAGRAVGRNRVVADDLEQLPTRSAA